MPGILAFVPDIALFLMTIITNTAVPEVGTILAAGLVGLTGLLVLWRPVAAVETLIRWSPLLLIGYLAVLSTTWSLDRMVSFRYGMQLAMTMFLGVHFARLLTARRFTLLLMFAFLVFGLLSLASGRTGPSVTGDVLIGLTGSKNQMGYCGVFLALSAVASLMLPRIGPVIRLIALGSIPLALLIVVIAHSLTALFMLVAGVALILVLSVAQRMPVSGRVSLLVALALFSIPVLMLAPEIEAAADYILFDVFDKDPTLTGRTQLWEHAQMLIAERPLAGWGFLSVWLGDSFESMTLQRLTGQEGHGFHFHNQVLQLGVDLGWIGMIAYILAMIATTFAALRQLILSPSVEGSFFTVIFFITLARTFTDVVISPFSFATLLFFACCTYAFRSPAPAIQHPFPYAPPMQPMLQRVRG